MPHQGPHDHDGDDLAALEDDLGGVVEVQQGKVGQVDGREAAAGRTGWRVHAGHT